MKHLELFIEFVKSTTSEYRANLFDIANKGCEDVPAGVSVAELLKYIKSKEEVELFRSYMISMIDMSKSVYVCYVKTSKGGMRLMNNEYDVNASDHQYSESEAA
jgi:hypothetical protein